ncbi:hypothetical protein [Nitrobacter sp. 62-13]|jgi:hypothetical protein|uniref:hypothetical protein n=1 Tax=Nitrobacter sp. 62-13 TaxID=1895797 RepID=UPI0025CBCF38|nr:hypothetical protein [Nitrobacter sp. 62-13]
MKKIVARIIFMVLLPIETVLNLTMQPSGTEDEAVAVVVRLCDAREARHFGLAVR